MKLFEYDDNALSNYEEMKIHQNNENGKIWWLFFSERGKESWWDIEDSYFEEEELATRNQMDLWGKH